MIPRNLYTYILAACVVLTLLGLCVPTRTDALATHQGRPGMTKSYCASTVDQPVVYVSGFFDIKTPTGLALSAGPLNFAFRNYLVEEYDFKSNANYPTNCGLFENLSQAEANKQQIMAAAQRANRKIIEVNWKPSPALAVAQDNGDDTAVFGKGVPPPTHTFCALGHGSTMYFSAVFDTAGSLNNPAWNDGFNEFLRKNYGAEGEATCTIMNTVREAEFNLKARVGGVRANSHKAVETGWRYNASVVVTKPAPKPTPKVDDDPEPPPRPAPAPISKSNQDLAVKEMPATLAYCEKDASLNSVFLCDCFRRLVYNYRIEHPAGPGGPEPLASLVAGEKLPGAECIDNFKVNRWASERATAQKLSPQVTNCVTQKFLVSFYEQTHLKRMNELYNAAVTACNK